MKMRKIPHVLSAVSLGLGLVACTTMGTGTGISPSGRVQATLTWTQSGSREGTMTAALTNGSTYTGSFFQITRETQVDSLGPLWTGWGRPWGGWPYWGGGFDAGPQFITEYSGRVVANLQGPDGRFMRCNFRLVRPASGMSGGGVGRCQLPDGGEIDANFPPGGTVAGNVG